VEMEKKKNTPFVNSSNSFSLRALFPFSLSIDFVFCFCNVTIMVKTGNERKNKREAACPQLFSLSCLSCLSLSLSGFFLSSLPVARVFCFSIGNFSMWQGDTFSFSCLFSDLVWRCGGGGRLAVRNWWGKWKRHFFFFGSYKKKRERGSEKAEFRFTSSDGHGLVGAAVGGVLLLGGPREELGKVGWRCCCCFGRRKNKVRRKEVGKRKLKI